jgi:hypothetical protein
MHNPDIVSCAMNAMGYTLLHAGQDGMPVLKQALRIALDADLHEAAGRAYSSVLEVGSILHRFEDMERYYDEGMAYCEDREFGVFSMCTMGWRAQGLLLTGRWDEAVQLCERMLGMRSGWSWPGTGGRPRPSGTGSAGRMTPPWPGCGHRTRPRSGTRSARWTAWAPARSPPRPGGGCGSSGSGRSRAGPAPLPGPPRPG